jgi:hypothetical protein
MSNSSTNYEELFDKVLNNLTDLAKNYAEDVVFPFCDKYELRLDSFDKYWCFYCIDRKKFPSELNPYIGEYLKTGKLPEYYSLYEEDIEPYEEFLRNLPDKFWRELEEIKAVESRLCKHENNMAIFNNYIQSYNDDSRLSWEPVTLKANDQELKLNGMQYDGKTLKELFTEYGHNFDNVDPDYPTAFTIGFYIFPDDAKVRPSETVRRVVLPKNLG